MIQSKNAPRQGPARSRGRSECELGTDIEGTTNHVVSAGISAILRAGDERNGLVEQVGDAAAQLEAFGDIYGRKDVEQVIGLISRSLP